MRRLLLALFLFVAACGTAAADDLIGRYDGMGSTPDNKNYKASVEIQEQGQVYIVLWKLADGAAYEGIGLRQGDTLGSAYGPHGSKFGLYVYQISGGTLTGTWADSTDLKSELGRETLEGSANLNGEYKVTLGQNRDGLTNYDGSVMLQPNGDTYVVIRNIGKRTTIGVAVRLGDLLVVATGLGKQMPGVVAYEKKGNNSLSGIWASIALRKTGDTSVTISASKKAGSETLVRAP
jgi:hypothetical protein